MASLIFALCAVLLCLATEWYARHGRSIESRENPVKDLRSAEAWATQLDKDLCDSWDTPRDVAVLVRAGLVVAAVAACAVVVPAMRLDTPTPTLRARMALHRAHASRLAHRLGTPGLRLGLARVLD